MEQVILGLIGAGSMGRIHIQNITRMPQARLKYISDSIPDKYNAWAEHHHFPLAGPDYQVMLEDPEVDAIIICAPAALHCDLIQEAASHGKHVFCEKPFDYDLKKIAETMKLIEQKQVKLQIGFNRRFDKNFAKARLLIDRGEVGDVHVLKITSRDPVPPAMEYFTATGGEHCSIYTDTTIHDFDMARYLNNSEVVEVFAYGSKLINKDKPTITRADTAVISLKFADQSLCVIDNSWQAVYGYDQRVEVFGTKGMVTVDNEIFTQATLHSKSGVTGEKPLHTLLDRYKESFAAEIRSFLSAILNDTPVQVTAEDGLLSMVIAKAAMKSAAEGRPVMVTEMLPD
jgi:myo-inositol 2-dehydrogenase/D-chiro-inositol 1-dehydrogenase